jgi:hypothetical protein
MAAQFGLGFKRFLAVQNMNALAGKRQQASSQF